MEEKMKEAKKLIEKLNFSDCEKLFERLPSGHPMIDLVFDRMEIDTNEVINGMNTKWNALGFRPGLVGGHCIGVDPYYFTYEAEKLGYHSQIILNGRIVNDGMGSFVASAAIKQMVRVGKTVRDAKVVIFGLTFKENCSDIRNSKVIDIITELRKYGISPVVVDPQADSEEAYHEYGVELKQMDDIKNADCMIVAVAHDEFKALEPKTLDGMFVDGKSEGKVLVDVKGIYDMEQIREMGFTYWRL